MSYTHTGHCVRAVMRTVMPVSNSDSTLQQELGSDSLAAILSPLRLDEVTGWSLPARNASEGAYSSLAEPNSRILSVRPAAHQSEVAAHAAPLYRQ
jgi:hypothetical protein